MKPNFLLVETAQILQKVIPNYHNYFYLPYLMKSNTAEVMSPEMFLRIATSGQSSSQKKKKKTRYYISLER